MEKLVLEKKQCLIAGDGFLPIELAKKVKENGLDLVIISLSSDNKKELQKIADKFYVCWPGEVQKIRQIIIDEGIKQVSFIGKVSKSLIVKSFLKLDKMARATSYNVSNQAINPLLNNVGLNQNNALDQNNNLFNLKNFV